MTICISILDKQINTEVLRFKPTTSGVLKEIVKKSEKRLPKYPSILNNEVQPLVDKFIELEEHEFKEKAVAFIKTALYVTIVAGLVMSSFVGTSGLLPLGLIVAWFVLQIWLAYDVLQKVDEIERFNPKVKESRFSLTGLLFLAQLPFAPLWEVYTRKARIEEIILNKLEEANRFFQKGGDLEYIARTYSRDPQNRTHENGMKEAYRNAVRDLFQLQTTCHHLFS
jgi:hypothetical protein